MHKKHEFSNIMYSCLQTSNFDQYKVIIIMQVHSNKTCKKFKDASRGSNYQLTKCRCRRL